MSCSLTLVAARATVLLFHLTLLFSPLAPHNGLLDCRNVDVYNTTCVYSSADTCISTLAERLQQFANNPA